MRYSIRRISTTLMLSFAVITALHLVTALIGGYGYRQIESQQHRLRDVVLPQTAASQRVAVSVPRLVLLLDALPGKQREQDLAELSQRIDAEIHSIRQDLDGPGLNGARTRRLFDELSLGLDKASVAKRVNLSSRKLFLQEQAAVLRLVDDIRLALDTLHVDQVRSDERERVVAQSLQDAADWQLQVSSLSTLAEAKAVERVQLRVSEGLRRTIRTLARVPALLQEVKVSRPLQQLLDRLTESSNLFGLRQAVISSELNLSAQVSRSLASAAALTAELDRIVDQHSKAANLSSVELDVVLRDSEQWFYAVSVLALALGLLFIRRFVIRGVAVPLADLTARTAALADGDLKSEVGAQRYSELAQIAESLEIFRANMQRLERAEQEMHEQNLRLNQANIELNRFAYAASHDLRTPLRGIRTLSGFIVDDLGDTPPPAVLAHVEKMVQRLTKMEQLLEDLLNYSKAGAITEARQLVDLEQLVQEALSLLDNNNQFELTLELEIQHPMLPPVAIQQVLRNLLDNALKHARVEADQPLQLTVRSRLAGDLLAIELEDNGSGIPAEYRERMLGLFQTLESNVTKQSSGIGLAMVQRLLMRYGGALRLLEPQSGVGTLVRVELPIAASPDRLLSVA